MSHSLWSGAFCPLILWPTSGKSGKQYECKIGLQGAASQGHTYMKEKLKANYVYASPCGSNLSFKDGVLVSPRRLDI